MGEATAKKWMNTHDIHSVEEARAHARIKDTHDERLQYGESVVCVANRSATSNEDYIKGSCLTKLPLMVVYLFSIRTLIM